MPKPKNTFKDMPGWTKEYRQGKEMLVYAPVGEREREARQAKQVNCMRPVEIEDGLLGLRQILIFDGAGDKIVLAFVGKEGTLNVPMTRKSLELFAATLNRRLQLAD
jgi:hypothetical protein